MLLERGQGFYGYTGVFRHGRPAYTGVETYAAPHRQWVYDSSIPGASVPSGVYVGPNFIPRNTSGLQLDFNKGAAYFPSGQNSTISGVYSYKEVNLYFTKSNEESFLFNKKFEVNPKNDQYTSVEAADFVYPCIIIKKRGGENKTLCFEGMASTTIPVRLTWLADTSYLYQSVCSILRDRKETFFPIFSPQEMPFNFFGDLVSGSFDYTAMSSFIGQDANRLAYLKDVRISDFTEDINNLITKNAFGGFIDLSVEIIRFPKLE